MHPRVTELHCIMPVANMESVMAHGILSYEKASKLPHRSVALPAVQDRRDRRHVPGGRKLHEYANLYFDARNPMMYKRSSEAMTLCVIRVDTAVFTLPGAVITDQNAASDYARFLTPAQWRLLDFDAIFARDWRHPNDQIAQWRHKAQKCAEVLIPSLVEPQHIRGAYVVDESVKRVLESRVSGLDISLNRDLFFRNV